MHTGRAIRTFTLILFAALFLASTADAGHDDRKRRGDRHGAHPVFEIGGVDLHVVVAGSTRGGQRFLIEASNLPSYPGHRCSDRCSVIDGAVFHHPDCPLLRHHLDRYGYDPGYLVPQQYGPVHSGIPPGHLPPPGECRVWFDDRPPGHQPPPTSCARAVHYAPLGARIIYGGPGR